VDSWVAEGVLGSYATFVMDDATKGVDSQFKDTLARLTLDVDTSRTVVIALQGECFLQFIRISLTNLARFARLLRRSSHVLATTLARPTHSGR
jgi:hypothetical protein